MIGIYVITNDINGQQYVGQSVDIAHRIRQHFACRDPIAIDLAIKKYGVDHFHWEVIEECSVDQLDEREIYWIHTLDTYNTGYNCSLGGRGTRLSGNTIYTIEEVKKLREIYASHNYHSFKEVYEKYGHGNKQSFREVFKGKLWSWVMPEVFTKENEEYYYQQLNLNRRTAHQWGEDNTATTLTEKLVLNIRIDYVNHNRDFLFQKYVNVHQRTIVSIISGQNWRHLPVYLKRKKQWQFPADYTQEQIDYYTKLIQETLNGLR